MQTMPESYIGREQTWLKHRVLQEYLIAWAHKLGSINDVHLWYVDVFAGPWEAQASNKEDTSIAIGLGALNQAAETWKEKGKVIQLHAIFVEKNQRSFIALQEFTSQIKGHVDVHTFHGKFGDYVGEINKLIDRDAAFIFVDPTGWDGAALQYIAKLGRPQRDILINVMYDYLNRFKEDNREFLRSQMREFFGLTNMNLPEGLDEDRLLKFYRSRLKQESQVPWVADLAVPVPTKDRTYFRLVIAGHHPKVVELFRDVEAQVLGREASLIRTQAQSREKEKRTRQLSLLESPPPIDNTYSNLRIGFEKDVPEYIETMLLGKGYRQWSELWPELLCEFHIRKNELKAIVLEMEKKGIIEVNGRTERERTIKDEHSVRWKVNR